MDVIKKIFGFIKRIPVFVALFFIYAYRVIISPMFSPCCRFTPTCSEYALQAFKKYGFFKGGMLTAKRLIRCRPGGDYGYDPVP